MWTSSDFNIIGYVPRKSCFFIKWQSQSLPWMAEKLSRRRWWEWLWSYWRSPWGIEILAGFCRSNAGFRFWFGKKVNEEEKFIGKIIRVTHISTSCYNASDLCFPEKLTICLIKCKKNCWRFLQIFVHGLETYLEKIQRSTTQSLRMCGILW